MLLSSFITAPLPSWAQILFMNSLSNDWGVGKEANWQSSIGLLSHLNFGNLLPIVFAEHLVGHKYPLIFYAFWDPSTDFSHRLCYYQHSNLVPTKSMTTWPNCDWINVYPWPSFLQERWTKKCNTLHHHPQMLSWDWPLYSLTHFWVVLLFGAELSIKQVHFFFLVS